MQNAIKLPQHLIEELRRPLGTLLRGSKDEVRRRLLELSLGKYVISVGDIVSKTLIDIGVTPNFIIIDGKTLRQYIEVPRLNEYRIVDVENPPSHITMKALNEIRKILEREESKVLLRVHGEEDLLGLPAILYAPYNSIVVYGQPGEGVVVVQVSNNAKLKAKQLMEQFEDC